MDSPWKMRISATAAALAFAAGFSFGCGKAKDLFTGQYLGPAQIGDDGSRTDGANLGNLYEVVQIVTATDGDFSNYGGAEYPFIGARILFNDTTTDRQVPFQFSYTYPPNNYKLSEAHIVIDTSRDTSDTEGIMVDGVFTGRVVNTILAAAGSPKVEYRYYLCTGCAGGLVPSVPANAFYMDWSLSHYKNGVINTFDLDVEGLLPAGTKTLVDVVSDGLVQVVTGDDSPIYNGTGYEPKLFLKGMTISRTPLSCSTSPTYQFRNRYVHNDGNTIGQAAFTGAVAPKFSVDNAPGGFRSVGFYFDPRLPAVAATSNISITTATVTFDVKRNATDPAAIVINGVGVSEASFDRNNATAAVETWNDSGSATSYWSAFLSGIATDNNFHTVTLDLNALLGAGTVRDLMAQGKLNIEVAGSLHTVNASADTSTRAYAVIVTGPEFVVNGTYFTQICAVPNDPTSPLSDNNPDPPGVGDDTSPLVTSVQAVNITSSSATIQWLTDEGADSQVGYGVGSVTTSTPLDATMVLFHSVELTGLQPYKYYYYEVRSSDGNGNPTVYSTKVFRTLR